MTYIVTETMWHVESVTPHSMTVDWTRSYTDTDLHELMDALVNGDPWGAAHLRITRVTPAVHP